ncbi:MAG: NAD-dependent protein deacetylase [Actinobacteria bacterium]|nr:NAD-dependent protein deacetylase [Actinomycetota bacterium]
MSSRAAEAAAPAGATAAEAVRRFCELGDIVVLSGAGLSTDSGIPDYRGVTGSRRRYAPMTYDIFRADPVARHRYWARSFLGWRTIARARPNDGHHAVAALQQEGLIRAIITQNVDGLHQAAGARDVIELHGGLDRTVCLDCGERAARQELDERLRSVNADYAPSVAAVNPDGDVELLAAELDAFVMVGCLACGGGPLKPDVVFFGENVPRERVERCYEQVGSARGLLVLGSSLTVMSGYRFVLRAAKLGIPVAIINQGPTRGDAAATLRLDAALGSLLPAVVRGSESSWAPPPAIQMHP